MELKRKVSDIVSDFIEAHCAHHVFAVSGGASLHLIHSIANNPHLEYICCHHEQSCAMAADAYSRIADQVGVVVATSGPGATNLITGIGCSYYDSVPLLAITGQVSTFRMTNNLGVRQVGFQETPIIDICKPITKYAVQITDPNLVLYHLHKALYLSKLGRPGPVLIDIPDNIQREYVLLSDCPVFVPPSNTNLCSSFPKFIDCFDDIISAISKSVRPILLVGWGVHLSSSEKFVIDFATKFSIPIVTTWAASDLLPHDHPLFVGTFGTHGQRHANFAVQNCDLLLSLGSRLDTKATGTPVNSFARHAHKIVVDIDPHELSKFNHFDLVINTLICDDLRVFPNDINLSSINPQQSSSQEWLDKINHWRDTFNSFDSSHRELNIDFVNPYNFFSSLSDSLLPDTNICIDTGCSVAWAMQSLRLNSRQRIFHDFNNTAMGWALPASIASAFAHPSRSSICIVGDGSLMMSVQELAVIKRHKLPIKIFLMNNSGYSMIQQTQDQWLESNYYASSYEGGLDFPNYFSLAMSFDIEYLQFNNDKELTDALPDILSSNLPFICDILISSSARVVPQVKAGFPNEDLEPLLPRDVFNAEMIVPPTP